MKVAQSLFWLFAFVSTLHALALPTSFESISDSANALFKRKGGGGGGGRAGGSSSSSSSSSSGSRSGSSSTGSSGTSGSRGTTGGVGPQPRTYAGGSYYGGGAATPYRAGSRSPGGVSPLFIGAGAGLAFGGLWLYGAYAYHYPSNYTYHNDTTNANETHPAECFCAKYQDCGCDSNNQTDYVNSLANNNTIAHKADVNGTQTLVINGTLPNGTTVATQGSGAFGLKHTMAETSGWWVIGVGVAYAVWFM